MTHQELFAQFALAIAHRIGSNPDVGKLSQLCNVGRKIHTYDEHDCNVGLTARERKQQDKLMFRARVIAREIGAIECYRQSDPRGWSLYLIFSGDIPQGASIDSCYSNGVGVPLLYTNI